MIMGKWRFWRQETRGKTKVLNKAGKIVLKKDRYTKKETSPRENSHIVSKLSPETSWKLFKMFKKLEAPEMTKKTLLSLLSNAQLAQICKEVQKPCCERDDYLFWMNAQYKYYWTGSCAPGAKKAQHGSSVGQHILLHAATTTECDKKNKKGMPVTEILNTCPR